MKNAQKTFPLLTAVAVMALANPAKAQTIISAWNFDNLSNGASALSPTASSGVNASSSTALSIGMTSTGTTNFPTANATGPDTSNIDNEVGTDTDNSGSANNVWRIVGTNGWNSSAAIGTQGAQFDVSTVGFANVSLSFDLEITSQGEANMEVEYSTNGGTTWTNAALTYGGTNNSSGSVLTNSSNANIATGSYFHTDTTSGSNQWYNDLSINLSGVNAANNDANLEVRIVNAATGSADVNLKGNTAINNTSGNWRLDDVNFSGTVAAPEPSAYALFVAGALALVGMQLRRRGMGKN